MDTMPDAEIRESSNFIDALFEGCADPIALYDTRDLVIDVNKAFVEKFGYEKEEIIGKKFPGHFGFDDGMFLKWKKKCETGTGISGYETIRITKKGKKIPVSITVSPVFGKNGRLQAMSFWYRDISKRKKYLDALTENEQKYRMIFEDAPLGIFRSTPEGRFIEVNKALSDMLGYDSPQDVIENINDIGGQIYVNTIERKNVVGSTINNENGKRFRNRYKRKDGTDFIADLYLKTIKDTDGKPLYLEGIVNDITEQFEIRQKLKDEEKRLQSIFKAVPAGIGVITNRVFMSVNDRFCEITGYSKEELIGQNARIIYPSDKEYEYVGREKYRQIEETGTGSVETRIRKKDGNIRYIVLSSSPMYRDDLSKGVTFSAIDITEKKMTENVIKESEERFQKMLNLVPDMISIHDTDMNIIYSNWNGFASVPVRLRKLKTKCYKTYRNLDDICPDCKAETVFNTKKPYHKEVYLPEGIWVDLRMIPLLNKEGEVELFMEWVRDITVRKKAVDALRESEKSFRMVIENLPHAVFAHNLDGKIIIVNKISASNTGYTEQELLNMYVKDIDPLSPSRDDRKNLWLNLKEGSYVQIESMHKRKDGSEFPVEITISAIFLKGEQIMLAIAQDISERKRSEEKINRQNNELEEANAAKDRFFSIIAHDLRSPISGLIGLTENVVKEFSSYSLNELSETANALHNSSSYLNKLLNNLLDWSRINRGKIEYKPENIKLLDISQESVELLRQTAANKKIEIINEIPANITVFCDKNMTAAVFRNLINNALKYSFSNGIVTIIARQADGNFIETSIKDNGTGIDRDTLKTLFDLDSVKSKPGTLDEKGTGLGLLLCKEYVNKNGGEIRAESKTCKGSTFYFTLPCSAE